MDIEVAPGIVITTAGHAQQAIIQGTQVPVALVLARLASGTNPAEVAKVLHITPEAVQAALWYAATMMAVEVPRNVVIHLDQAHDVSLFIEAGARGVHVAERLSPEPATAALVALRQALGQAAPDDTPLITNLKAQLRDNGYVAFADAVRTTDWSAHTADELLQVLTFVLDLQLPGIAVSLARQARELFPSDERVQHSARILLPEHARVIAARPQPQRLRESLAWVQAHGWPYRGQWVAVSEGRLLGAATTLSALREQLGYPHGLDGVLITKVH